MAEAIGLVASVITLGGVAVSAAELSITLFKVAQTLKNAPHEIAEIAEEISSLSGTLLTLEDFIDAYRSICKPALFQNTTTILKRYNKVEAELKKLIEDANSINKLKWPFRKCKAKGLLKKVEGIKTALILELNIIQLARDEILQSQRENSATSLSAPRPNRFRKIVECAVAASRQVVESSQREDAKQSEWQKREFSMELRVWDEDLFDTATWLYHLVFSPGPPSPYAPPGAPRESPYQASVSDDNAEQTEDLSEQTSEVNKEQAESSSQEDKALIIWSGATAPDLVVDRLLSTWTTLTNEQINHSSVNHVKDKWTQSLDKMIDEAKEEEEAEGVASDSDSSSFNDLEEELDEWDAEERSKLSEPSISSSSPDSVPRNQQASSRRVRWDDEQESLRSKEPSESSKPKANNSRRPTIRKARRNTSSTVDSSSDYGPGPNPERGAPPKPARSPYANQSSNPHLRDSSQSRASDSSYYPYGPSYHSSPSEWSSSVPHPLRMPHQPYISPFNPFVNGPQQIPVPPKAEEGDDTLVASVEKLIAKHQSEQKPLPSDPRLGKILDLLISQQEHHIEAETARTKAIAEAELKSLHEARDKERGDFRRLEKLILQQREEHQKAEAAWQAERVAMDEKMSKQIQEARDLTTKELNAANAAKRAVKQSKRYARAQVEERERQDAVNREEDRRKRIEEDYQKRMERYEELVRGKVQPEQPLNQLSESHPVRRTCITEGNHSIEVSEFTSQALAPLSNASLAPFRFSQDEILLTSPIWDNRGHRPRSSFAGAPASLHNSRLSLDSASTVNTAQGAQSMILFPSRADRDSTRTLKLQRSLAESGIEAVFDDSENRFSEQLVRYEEPAPVVPRCTLFWEPPMLRLRSELLQTMRNAGWKPLYVRVSDAGQTFFLGNQPIHSYIFRPDFTPQFTASPSRTSNHSVVVNAALVELSAVEELGFQCRCDGKGAYILDGRLTYSDIEDLIERSFSIRETYFRRIYRDLPQIEDDLPQTPDTPTDAEHSFASSVRSESSDDGTETSATRAETRSNRSVSTTNLSERSRVNGERFHVFDCEEEELPSIGSRSASTMSPSTTSWSSSKSTNPFYRLMEEENQKKRNALPDANLICL